MNNGIKILSDYEQVEADYAEKRIAEFKAIKESLLYLMSEARRLITVSQFDFDEELISIEQSFENLVQRDWDDAVEMSGSLEEMPRSTAHKKWLHDLSLIRENKAASQTSRESFLDALNAVTAASMGGVQ